MTDRYDELRAAAEAATPGPWVSQGRYIGTPNHMSYIGEVRDQNGNWSDSVKSRSDAAFIALANPATITALLSERDASEAKCWEIAAERDALAERVRVLEGALKPFNHDPKSVLDMDYQDDEPLSGLYNDWNFSPFPTFGDFRRVRSLLNPHQDTALSPSPLVATTPPDDMRPNKLEVGKPLPYFCPACQAIPTAGYCRLAGCPTAPSPLVEGGR